MPARRATGATRAMIDETEDAHRALVGRIEDLSRAGIASCDPRGQLSRSTADVIVQVLVEAVYDVLMVDGRRQLSEDDRAYIREMTRRLTKDRLPKPPGSSKRFSMSDRVVCCVGGERGWAAGTVQALDQDGVFPYVVKLDPPDTRLVSVPTDTSEQVRAEVCFGQRAGAMHFTRMCLPNALLRQKRRTPRFAAGERVACAVEDATSEYSDWSAGTVLAVNCTVKEWEGFPEGDSTVPYQVGLDAGDIVLVHVRRLLRPRQPHCDWLRLADMPCACGVRSGTSTGSSESWRCSRLADAWVRMDRAALASSPSGARTTAGKWWTTPRAKCARCSPRTSTRRSAATRRRGAAEAAAHLHWRRRGRRRLRSWSAARRKVAVDAASRQRSNRRRHDRRRESRCRHRQGKRGCHRTS